MIARLFLLALVLLSSAPLASAATYEVGAGKPYATPSAVPWESLQPGDLVLIYWQATPYRDKWVICRQGTATAPIVVRGVPGPAGERPVIDGNGAVTRLALDYWGETRAVIKIGGASIPADTMPKYTVVEGLDIRSGRPPYAFTDDAGANASYVNNAAAVWIEKGENITIRNNILHDSGNGLFVSSAEPNISRTILIEANYIYDNGNVGSIYEHNTYTEALGITYQLNRLGPLRAGAGGNNLKDRSAGLVVRYNWIEGGNRQLDLVETDSATIQGDPSYRATHVYGNVLIEPDAAGNRQITHYGGDNGTTSKYRKGTLHFYQNTLVSTRTDRTTLFRLSTNDEHADARNNIFYPAAHTGSNLSLLDDTGILNLTHNWFKAGYVGGFSGVSGAITDDGTSVIGNSPGFISEASQDFRLTQTSDAVNEGTVLASGALPVVSEYVKHLGGQARPNDGVADLGAFEMQDGQPADLAVTTSSLPNGTTGLGYSAMLGAAGGLVPYSWSVVSGGLPTGLALNAGTGGITGTPTTQGTSSFTVQVIDGQVPADTATRTLQIAVLPVSYAPLVITTTSLPNARRNKNYSRTVAATGGLAPYTWSVVLGSLSSGLTLNASTGVISGKATTIGTYAFTVQARDSQGAPATDTQGLSITVTR
ncbi:MAG: putative Ig domain-containing protein [Vicinamibacteria bacterium]|nr:putative Ig domain-containing protein [Vicinamibacteria bacterium]